MSSDRTAIKLLLTGGGTGGHLFPAIAAAEELLARMPQAEVMFIGTRRKMDSSSLSHYGFRVESVYCYGLKGKNLVSLIKALAALPVALVQAARLIRSFRPDVVLGVGGYVTGPVIAAARLLGKKTVIHEQNSIPGLANRALRIMVDRICISLPGSAIYFPGDKTVLTGNPVRSPIRELAAASLPDTVAKTKTLVVLGGSQGAHRLNELVGEAICDHGAGADCRVIHQTGETDCLNVRQRYHEHGINAQVEAFFRDMAAVYGQADLVISRAGATTLAELAILGLPAILVPYPHAADDHQQENARHYVDGGGCRAFKEKELDGRKLAAEMKGLLADDASRHVMAVNMRKLGHLEAAAKIVDVCQAAVAS